MRPYDVSPPLVENPIAWIPAFAGMTNAPQVHGPDSGAPRVGASNQSLLHTHTPQVIETFAFDAFDMGICEEDVVAAALPDVVEACAVPGAGGIGEDVGFGGLLEVFAGLVAKRQLGAIVVAHPEGGVAGGARVERRVRWF